MQQTGRIVRQEIAAIGYAGRIALTALVVVAVTVVMPLRTSASSQVPFQATLTETVTGAAPCAPGSPVICVNVTGTGWATHLGAIHESLLVREDYSSNPASDCHSEVRTSILTAANGDQITLQGPGLHCGFHLPTSSAHDSWTVIAGTGRFSGATGSGTDSASINAMSVPATAVSTFSGTISSPGSLR